MFVGREKELQSLEKMYASEKFEFYVLYGQRRIGKTTLLAEFIKDKKVIFLTAKEVNDQLNLAQFTLEIEKLFGMRPETLRFENWEAAFIFLAEHAADQKILVVIDEYPYAATVNSSLNSMLQVAIDHYLVKRNVKIVLSGSHVSFIE